MNPFFIQIRKYTLRQIMNAPPLLPKPKAPIKLLQKSKLKEFLLGLPHRRVLC